jgi:recombination protein RecT
MTNKPTESTALTPIKQVCNTIKMMSDKIQLPAGLSVERFLSTASQGVQMHREREKLLSADRASLYQAIQKAASDGLILDGREAALVVFSGEVQYMPMTQGLIKLARNSGEIANITSAVVYEKDKFTYKIGIDEAPIHEAEWFSEDRGAPVGAWALVTLTNGEKIPAILPKSKIMKIAAKGRNGYQYDPDKGFAFDEWWKKTAVKNALKYAPKSTELEKILQSETEQEGEYNQADVDVNDVQEIEITPPEPKAPSPQPRTRAAAAVAAAIEVPESEIPL